MFFLSNLDPNHAMKLKIGLAVAKNWSKTFVVHFSKIQIFVQNGGRLWPKATENGHHFQKHFFLEKWTTNVLDLFLATLIQFSA